MPDRFFYPFIIVLIAAIVTGAIFAGGPLKANSMTADQITQQGFTLSGENLRRMVNPAGTAIDFAGDAQQPTRYAVASAFMTRQEAPPSAGVFAELNSEYESAFGGKTLKVIIRARQGRENPTDQFLFQYFTASVGDSPPKQFTLTPDFEDYSFEFNPNPPAGNPGADYIGIWPDLSGQGRTMDVESIRVEVIPN